MRLSVKVAIGSVLVPILSSTWPARAETSTVSASEIEAITTALQHDEATAPVSEGATQNTAGPTSNLIDIGAVLSAAASLFSDGEASATGEHDPSATGFTLQALELTLAGRVDPYFRVDSAIVLHPEGVDLEEAYATATSLPWLLQARAGLFLTRFGRKNATHPHAWNMVDQPWFLGRLFGGEGHRGPGLEVSWLSPLPWYAELVGSMTMGSGEGTNRSFLADADRTPRRLGDFAHVGALKQFFPLDEDWSLAVGLSLARGPNTIAATTNTNIFGADVYLKYRPITFASSLILSVEVEGAYRRRHVSLGVIEDHTGYAELYARFFREWGAAIRFDWGTPEEGAVMNGSVDERIDPEWTTTRTRMSLSMGYSPSEFARLRIQGSRSRTDDVAPVVWAAMLQIELILGAHGAHVF